MTNKPKFDNTKDYPFLAFCSELSQRCSQLNALDVQIYSTMFDDAPFYEYNYGHYTPAHADIALDCATSRSSVIRCINHKLIPLGLVVEIAKHKGGSSTYKVVDYRKIEGLLDRESLAERKQARRDAALAERTKYLESIALAPKPVEESIVEQIIEDLPSVEPTPAPEPEPIVEEVLELKVTEVEPVQCPVSDGQLSFYCSITGAEKQQVRDMLAIEPTAAQSIFDVLSAHQKEQEESNFFKNIASKADPHHTGTTPPHEESIWGDDAPF